MQRLIKHLLVFLCVLIIPLTVSAKDNEEITLYLFHGNGCPHCAEEMEYLDSIYDDYEELKVVKYEVWYNEENASLLQQVEEAFDIKRGGVPTTVIGNTVFTGFSSTTSSKIKRAIEFYIENVNI